MQKVEYKPVLDDCVGRGR